jgi:hypothetical protein
MTEVRNPVMSRGTARTKSSRITLRGAQNREKHDLVMFTGREVCVYVYFGVSECVFRIPSYLL